MPFALQEDLYFCLTDRGAIFLDLTANRYFCLNAATDHAFRRIVIGDALDPSLERDLRPLLSEGLLHRAESLRAMSPPSVEPPVLSLAVGAAPAAVRTIAAALGHHVMVRLEMRTLGLKTMVGRRRTRKRPSAVRDDPAASIAGAHPVLAAHRAVDKLVGGVDRCLVRSLALIDHLARHDLHPDMVIGVRAGAFSAHCWVQQGSTLLNDEVDRIKLFTPILVL